MEDFTYLLHVPNLPSLHVREIRPKDFYFAQILRQSDRSYVELLDRLILNPEVLDTLTATQTRVFFTWITENLLNETVFTVENWLEVSFHLCKQRWDSTMEWLEDQPISKIQLMIQIVKNHAEEQEKAAKKAAKSKK